MKNLYKFLILFLSVFIGLPSSADVIIPFWTIGTLSGLLFEGYSAFENGREFFTLIIALILLLIVSLIESFIIKIVLKIKDKNEFSKLLTIVLIANLISTIVGFLILPIVGRLFTSSFIMDCVIYLTLFAISFVIEYMVIQFCLKNYKIKNLMISVLLANIGTYFMVPAIMLLILVIIAKT